MESDGLEGMLELVNWAVLLEAHIQLRDGEPLVCNSSFRSLCEYFSHFEDVAGCFLEE